MLKAQKVLTYRGVLFCCFIIIFYTSFRLPNNIGSTGWIITIIALYCNSMSHTRYILQYFVLYCILFVVSEQLKAIMRSIDSEAMKKNSGNEEDWSSIIAVNHNRLNKWLKAYETMHNSSNLCNSIFSVQVSL